MLAPESVDDGFDFDGVDPETAQFIAEQRSAITSTDVAGILGLSRYKTPLSVYRAKVEPYQPRQASLRAWVGARLETLVAELFTSATGLRLRADNGFYRHPKHEWLGTHLDRRVVGQPRTVVELKTRGSTRGWGPDGSAEVPPDVWCQIQTQMLVIGSEHCYVACLFSSSDYRTYRVPFDAVFADRLVPDLERFWYGHVQAGVAPAPTGSDVDTEMMKALPGGGREGVMKAATAAQEMLALRLKVAKAETARAQLAQAEVENQIRQVIGEDAGLVGSFGRITYKRTKDGYRIEWEDVALAYRRALEAAIACYGRDGALPVPGVEPTITTDVLDALVSIHASVRPGHRQLVTDFRED